MNHLIPCLDHMGVQIEDHDIYVKGSVEPYDIRGMRIDTVFIAGIRVSIVTLVMKAALSNSLFNPLDIIKLLGIMNPEVDLPLSKARSFCM